MLLRRQEAIYTLKSFNRTNDIKAKQYLCDSSKKKLCGGGMGRVCVI